MKYLYKKTGAVVESGIRLNPAIFKPIVEEENISAEEVAAAITEEIPAEAAVVEAVSAADTEEAVPAVDVAEEAVPAEAAEPKTSPTKAPAKASGVQKKTPAKKTASTKR